MTVELGTNTVLGAGRVRISEIATLLDDPVRSVQIPSWDGCAGVRAAEAILSSAAL